MNWLGPMESGFVRRLNYKFIIYRIAINLRPIISHSLHSRLQTWNSISFDVDVTVDDDAQWRRRAMATTKRRHNTLEQVNNNRRSGVVRFDV